MSAFYNEFDAYPAQWIRNLIDAGHIAPGVVDERSIADLRAADVAGPGQRHFFAGIAGWSLALRLAGIPDDADIWTGSCPCQPFSDAGRKLGTADERHLWPVLLELVRECRPAILLGEQVASRDGRAWLASVRSDLEALGYAVGAADLCAAGVGAPHIRQRLYFVAYSDEAGRVIERISRVRADTDASHRNDADRRGADDIVADAEGVRRSERVNIGAAGERHRAGPADGRGADWMGDADREHSGRDGGAASGAEAAGERERQLDGRVGDEPGASGRARGPWAACDWLPCSDGKSRPVEPGTRPLAHGVPGRVGKLRAYGNAIVPQQAAAFIRAALGAITEASP